MKRKEKKRVNINPLVIARTECWCTCAAKYVLKLNCFRTKRNTHTTYTDIGIWSLHTRYTVCERVCVCVGHTISHCLFFRYFVATHKRNTCVISKRLVWSSHTFTFLSAEMKLSIFFCFFYFILFCSYIAYRPGHRKHIAYSYIYMWNIERAASPCHRRHCRRWPFSLASPWPSEGYNSCQCHISSNFCCIRRCIYVQFARNKRPFPTLSLSLIFFILLWHMLLLV